MIYFIIAILFLLLEFDCANTNCSAINSYVQITSPPDLFPPSGTLTSAKALFGPYSYYIPPTELILLDPNTNNICAEDGITTDITNKIILIFESNGQCSNHYKAYVAQKNNAAAVLLANNDNSGEVSNIIDDNSLKNTQMTMAMRSISHIDGQILQNHMINGTNIMIEFSCFTNDYPSHICILDTEGSFWYLDGDYQRQQMTYNDHPVYKKEGYVYLLNNIYIFQHNGNGDTDWYWAITVDSNLANENAIRAKCAIADIYEPSLCTSWNVTNKFEDNYESDNLIPFSKYNYLNISNGLCIISDLYLCIDSIQSNLAGLHGTYRQWHSQVPFWFRELDDCDTRPAFLTFNNGKFILYDSMTNWKIAMCTLHETFTQNTWDWAKLIPTHCKDWETIVNDSLIEQTAIDETFSIAMDTKCEDINININIKCNSSSVSPNKLCMDKNSVMHGFLEGEYIKTNSIGPNYGTVEYERKDKLYYENTLINIYIWWFGEIDADRYSWWVLSDSNLTTAITLKGYVNIYGYCESKTNNPIYCNTQWKFYFINNFHTDYSFELYSGQCNIGQAVEEYIWSDYICVGLINETSPLSKKNAINTNNNNEQILESKTFVGGYKINTTSTKLSDGYPHWIKPKNINWEYEDIYIYFDAFFGYWQIGNGLHVDDGSILICYQEKDYSPIDCQQWYDIIDLTLLDNIYLYECTENDILTLKSNNNTSNVNIGEIIGIILVILFCICCIATLYWFYKKNSIGTMQTTQTNAKSVPVKKQDSIEMMDGIRTDSNAGLTTNTVQIMKKQDFALIHPESQTPIESPEQSLGDNDLIDDNDSEKKTIIKQESNATSTSESIDDEKKNENDESDESQIEDDDEKKDEDEKGIDSRRMSQQMIKAMQSDLNQWTDALINDPTAAARRYSRHSTVDEKFVIKVMNNKDLDKNTNKKDDNKDDNKDNESLDPLFGNDEKVNNETVNDNNVNINNNNNNNNKNDDNKPSEWTQFE